jgi:hypothetical protein
MDRNRYAEIMAQYQQAQPFSFTGYPSTYTGGYDVSQPQAYAAPVNRYQEIMAQSAMTGPGGRVVDYNPTWTAMSDAEKAAYYAENPGWSKFTQLGQNIFGFTWPGALQKGVVPDFVARQKLIAQGINPDGGSGDPTAGREIAGTDAFGTDPSASFGFVQAPGEAGRGGSAPVAPAPTGGFTPYSGALNAVRSYDAMGREVSPNQAALGGANVVVSDARSAAEAQARADSAAQDARVAAFDASRESTRGGGGGGMGGGVATGGNNGDASGGGDRGTRGGFAQGGHVSMMHLQSPNPIGPDDGYAALKDGEYVINDKAVKKYGIELMNAINTGKISKGKLRGLLEM